MKSKIKGFIVSKTQNFCGVFSYNTSGLVLKLLLHIAPPPKKIIFASDFFHSYLQTSLCSKNEFVWSGSKSKKNKKFLTQN